MFNANMPSLSDIAAVTGNDRDGGWGGNGWWIIIILLCFLTGFCLIFTKLLNDSIGWKLKNGCAIS